MHAGSVRRVFGSSAAGGLRGVVLALALLLAGGCEPADQRPGAWLSGPPAAAFPEDWTFSNAHREIFVEVATPYFLPHSVTIWCAEVDGKLFIAARDPDSKRWPGWVDETPEVTLKIGDALYPARLERLDDPTRIARVGEAYRAKYELPGALTADSSRFWSVLPRS